MIQIVTLGKRWPEDAPTRRLFRSYVERASRYTPAKELGLPAEEAFLLWLTRQPAGAGRWLVLLDRRGKSLSSEQFAADLGRWRDAGKREIILAVGPADGWSDAARRKSDFLLSFGPMTLPHELAAVVAAEQIYRALTILAGHPYHCGH